MTHFTIDPRLFTHKVKKGCPLNDELYLPLNPTISSIDDKLLKQSRLWKEGKKGCTSKELLKK